MTRTELDLRGKTMTELQRADRENSELLAGLNLSNPEDEAWAKNLLADRRQIRAEMNERIVVLD